MLIRTGFVWENKRCHAFILEAETPHCIWKRDPASVIKLRTLTGGGGVIVDYLDGLYLIFWVLKSEEAFSFVVRGEVT